MGMQFILCSHFYFKNLLLIKLLILFKINFCIEKKINFTISESLKFK